MAKTKKKSRKTSRVPKKVKKSPQSPQKNVNPLDLQNAEKSWVQSGLSHKKVEAASIQHLVLLTSRRLSPFLKKELTSAESHEVLNSSETGFRFHREKTTILVKVLDWKKSDADLAESQFSYCRNAMGVVFSSLVLHKTAALQIDIEDTKADVLEGVLLGLDLAAYKYWERVQGGDDSWQPALKITRKGQALPSKMIDSVVALSRGMNLARHLVNLPPNILNPKAYSESLLELFKNSPHIEVQVWDESRLKSEGMGLILAVGQAAAHGPRLVHLRYRPRGAQKKPIALVGKGVTFDSGGLDIKPANFMRWMKKDMGGSASVVGTLRWAELSGLNRALDVYLPLAENAVSSDAFRPGDVIVGRNKKAVEIHNTDAEGRLVLADAFDVAVTQNDKNAPSEIIDVATLTGAIKASLGAQVAGLFSNNAKLRDRLFKASLKSNDHCWPMPLFQPYGSVLSSPVADYANCSDAMGGAVTAALFLEKYVRGLPWAHFDIYAFVDSPTGCFREKGGNGQCVQLLAQYLRVG